MGFSFCLQNKGILFLYAEVPMLPYAVSVQHPQVVPIEMEVASNRNFGAIISRRPASKIG